MANTNQSTAKKPIIIITGASSGIGAALAKCFHQAGYPLLLLARRLEPMQALNLENAICMQVDVTDYAQVEKAINQVVSNGKQIGCLINNAGVVAAGQFHEQAIADIEKMISVNVTGVVNSVRATLPHMRDQNFGTVINISSLSDRLHIPHTAVYGGTKAALQSMAEAWRKGNRDKNIRFCNIAPAYVETPIWDGVQSPLYENVKANGGLITADELAEMILWIYQQPQHISIRDFLVTPTASEL